ncbi:hypothetical protein COO91_00822 [Nostoc flagelliforme CCNUN1]|uniref:Uncharacterized protein n=1 Tax=Nostoc flagelliforme CCNUN1 TaxID=2038116 RepID=A0A2K8SHS8_9NOSO|nr:hypothetical protein [Nostoc flagelliforme]AUB34978.1 hypothetical protein COO91_00822 [Nostoc flagelliforme CCNUN1]
MSVSRATKLDALTLGELANIRTQNRILATENEELASYKNVKSKRQI